MKFLTVNSNVLLHQSGQQLNRPQSARAVIISYAHQKSHHLQAYQRRNNRTVEDTSTRLSRYIESPVLSWQCLLDGRYVTCESPVLSPTRKEMNCGILERLRQTESSQYIQLLQKTVDCTLHDHRPVFKCEDLQLKNIMVERAGSHYGGSPAFKVILIG